MAELVDCTDLGARSDEVAAVYPMLIPLLTRVPDDLPGPADAHRPMREFAPVDPHSVT